MRPETGRLLHVPLGRNHVFESPTMDAAMSTHICSVLHPPALIYPLLAPHVAQSRTGGVIRAHISSNCTVHCSPSSIHCACAQVHCAPQRSSSPSDPVRQSGSAAAIARTLIGASMSARARRARGAKPLPLSPGAPLSPAPAPAGKVLVGKVIDVHVAEVRTSILAGIEDLKTEADNSYSIFVKDLAASTSRLSKRIKLDLQSTSKLAEDVDREQKEFTADVTEDLNEIGVTCESILAEAQSHFSKTGLPELLKSFEKSIEALRSKYGVT